MRSVQYSIMLRTELEESEIDDGFDMALQQYIAIQTADKAHREAHYSFRKSVESIPDAVIIFSSHTAFEIRPHKRGELDIVFLESKKTPKWAAEFNLDGFLHWFGHALHKSLHERKRTGYCGRFPKF